MNMKQIIERFGEKTKSIWNSIINYTFIRKIRSLWGTGKIQKTSRVTYDVIWNVILFFLIIGFVVAFFVGGLGAGYFASLVKDEPIRSQEDMESDIYNYSETSKLYFSNDIYIGDIRSELKREETTLDKISPTLVQAVTATEDEYFLEHEGVVPKAIFRALFQEVTNASVQSGGSTLTQQLIKNQILTNEVSFERKAKEILLALRLENFFEKDEILEAYLNIVPYGRNANGDNIAGIQTAAQGIFGLDADEVNIAQAAYLAGLPQSPSYYTPFQNSGGLKEDAGIKPGLDRMKTVLNRMLEMGHITKEEYQEALNYDLVADFIKPEASPIEEYPYLVRELQIRAEEIIKEKLAEEDGYEIEELETNEELADLNEEYELIAEKALQNNGYRIHSTIDKEIYDAFQEVAENFKHYGPNKNTKLTDENGDDYYIEQYVQAAAFLVENKTGRIISFLGGREYSEDDQTNYVTSKRSNGSTMKPFVYASAMDKGVVQPGTPIADVYTVFPPNNYAPNNFDLRYHGLLSARDHLKDSYNIPAIKTYMKILNDNPVEQYIEKMGITTLRDNEYANPSLAIGATTDGITLEENTNAYNTFANNGKFVDAVMIDKITTVDGDVIYEHETEPVEVFSPQTAYLTIDMMRDVISNGSATYLNSQLKYTGVDWAGKTGTSQNVENVHFVGVNPNVTFGTWLGYEYPDSLRCDSCSLYHSNRNLELWSELVNVATDINPELLAPSERFAQPEGIVSRSYCAISGMLPSELCAQAGLVKTDLFNAKFVPTQTDNSLVRGARVMVNGKAVLAGSNTPDGFVEGNGLMFNPEWFQSMGYNKLSDPTQLYPSKEREKWEKIALPGSNSHSSISDDGKAPGQPTSINTSEGNLVWSKSDSNDVVGYRIFRSSSPDGNFELIGSTTQAEFQVGNDYAFYHVKAVDYFGSESTPSSVITVGEAPEPETEEEEPSGEESPDESSSQNNEANGDNSSTDSNNEDN
ncbi:transglycosylase domain-containing protein [Oceanobacillus bengalensis]|uniref:Penicillin-binding protein n=1 Tax=Oceanobacillus bengalensis TaxID=1435466 RepID=A0A494YY22_9BACI|nr:transglycosylase domain-containing protein [Oceanobacillus bengalensis]RKQ14606.1 penicillin-binding protein [Oceanobacillus bengalensis]